MLCYQIAFSSTVGSTTTFFLSVRPSLEPGWLEGCLDGKCGLIPENYVEFVS
jgi:hypothetical protein